jgi:ribosomal protein L1
MAIIVPIVSAWNPAGLNRALKDIQRAKTDFDKFVAGTSSIGKSMSNVGKSLSMNLTLPLTLVGAASVRTAADFEVAMAQVGVATDTPVAGLENLSSLAKQLGAVDAGSDDLIEKVLAGFNDFDKCVATQAVFANVSKKLARILGPKNLLPSLKAGTVSANLTAMIKDVLGGQVSLRASKTGTVATSIGRVSFSDEKIIENVNALIAKVKSLKPEGLKSVFIKSASISTTMGFGVDLKIS